MISQESPTRITGIGKLKLGDNNAYKIDLKTNEYNFYMVGNSFTKQFFIYY